MAQTTVLSRKNGGQPSKAFLSFSGFGDHVTQKIPTISPIQSAIQAK